jgi:hypothetical protein
MAKALKKQLGWALKLRELFKADLMTDRSLEQLPSLRVFP